jgi:SAM-dependent methyltransferase
MKDIIPDQIPVWDKKHNAGDHERLRFTPSPLARLVEPRLKRKSYILELGCGVGRDAVFFAENGHKVIATDGSATAVQQDKEHFADSEVDFSVLDMRKPLPYATESFDLVFANLSLHYYSHNKTGEIIAETARALKVEGVLALACKSYDSLHGSGTEIEQNIYASPTGATIHLFSDDYTRKLLEDQFVIDYLDEIEEEYKGRYSKIVRCIAKKR